MYWSFRATQIDPKTAEVWREFGRYSDPYNFYHQMPEWSLSVDDYEVSETIFCVPP
jgi:hypothetical protein